ncbi:hypothetical protein [Streptomyces sp. ALI-76-A]|jgi:hypothetical protein|uniref:hypothetical protein n=1 Tax=Streptomyces sp. ALI-76-A TaxID=3025736 RepID=UPI00256EF879|nr:hypothetical protein [Streptomyces sp. ALI-76-A]MDL5204745.1 hypothetical protein [Streptomyces sp. ALI-76-A]
MCRSARALSVAVLAGAVLGLAVPAASAEPTAAAEPTAEVSPGTASPGDSVTVSVACEPTGGPAPDTIDAASEAFEAGSVKLKLVPGEDDELSGPAYEGTARLAPAEHFEEGVDAVGPDSAWTVDGTCPAPPGGKGAQWSVTFTVQRGSDKPCAESHTGSCATGTACAESHTGSCATSSPCAESHTGSCATGTACAESHTEAESCGGAVVPRGVRAGAGGAFTDSVPALVAGGLLIAGAFGAAVHRLRRKEPATDH